MKSEYEVQHSDLAALFLLLAHLWDYPRPELISKSREIFESLGEEIPEGAFEPDEELEAEYVRLFINAPDGVPAAPYASVQLTGLMAQQPAGEALAFYQQAGLIPQTTEPSDHLSTELAFVAQLLERQELALLRDFLEKHLLRWFPLFRQALEKARPHPFYWFLAEVTEKALGNLKEEVKT